MHGFAQTPAALVVEALWNGPGSLVSARGAEFLAAVAPNCAEFLPFTVVGGKDYFVVNVPRGVDVLDESLSALNRSPAGAIVGIRRHAFQPGVRLPGLFKLAGRLDGDLYCTPSVAVAIAQSGLKGFSFWNPLKEHLRDLFMGNNVGCVPTLGA